MRKLQQTIPLSRREVIQECLKEVDPALQADFEEFCQILTAYVHYRYHGKQEELKQLYAPFDPDRAELESVGLEPAEFITQFTDLAKDAHFEVLPEEVLKVEALQGEDIVGVATQVDFDIYDQLVCYTIGEGKTTVEIGSFLGWIRRKKQVDVFERVILLLKLKDREQATPRQIAELQNRPEKLGKMFLYYYRNVPRHDLELILPNVKVSMKLRHKIAILLTAITAAIALAWTFSGKVDDIYRNIDNLEHTAHDFHIGLNIAIIKPLILPALILAGFGGLVCNQFNNYNRKRNRFHQQVSENLFFRYVANNHAVFHRLLDAAEEEVTKQMILVYHHVTRHPGEWTKEALDSHIERWVQEKSGKAVDFDIQAAVDMLGEISIHDSSGGRRALLETDSSSYLHILSFHGASSLLDSIWDDLFKP